MNVWLRLQFCLPVLLLLTAGAYAQSPQNLSFSAEKYGFSVSYPVSFSPLKIDTPMVALALRHIASPFPTFNVIVQPGSYDPKRTLELQQNDVLESYRKIGLTAVKALKSEILELPAGPAFQTRLEYTSSGKSMTSSVTILSTKSMHFILTWLDETGSFEANRVGLAQILTSFALTRASLGDSAGKPAGGSLSQVLLPVSAAVLLVLLLLTYFRRHSK